MAGPYATAAPRPQLQTPLAYAQRASSDSSTSSAEERTSSHSTTTVADPAPPRVQVLRCSRCAKCVETITHAPDSEGVGPDDLRASGMVRFGHNLYYCDRCAKIVGYT